MASKSYLVDLDLNKNELQNAVIQNLSSAPANPKAGQHYFNTADNTEYVWNGTAWQDALSQGRTYTFSTGLTEASGTVTLNQATSGALGGVIVGSNISVSSGTISVADASTTGKGVIEIATDTEASTGTDTTRAINAKQLATKVTANTAITGATKCKITYDSKGLVTAGADLQASDIPDISATYQTKLSSTNKLSTDYISGLATVATSGAYSDLSGKPTVDQTYSGTSTNAQSGVAVKSAIDAAISSVYKPAGSVAFASLPTLGSSIEGNVYNVTDAFTTTADFVEGAGKSYPAGTNVVCINTSGTTYKWDVLAGMVDTSSFITASSTNTLTNKTIDADDNTISDLATSNFKSGVVVTSVGSTGADTSIPTEKAVRSAITSATSGMVTASSTNTFTNKTIDADDNTIQDLTTSNFKSGVIETTLSSSNTAIPTSGAVETAIDTALTGVASIERITNPALTASGGVCTWEYQGGANIMAYLQNISVYETSTGQEVICDITSYNHTITIKFNSASNISAGTYTAVIVY